MSTASGLFSLLTLPDTWWGKVTSTRDGTVPYGLRYADAEALSLHIAQQCLAARWQKVHGRLGLLARVQAPSAGGPGVTKGELPDGDVSPDRRLFSDGEYP